MVSSATRLRARRSEALEALCRVSSAPESARLLDVVTERQQVQFQAPAETSVTRDEERKSRELNSRRSAP